MNVMKKIVLTGTATAALTGAMVAPAAASQTASVPETAQSASISLNQVTTQSSSGPQSSSDQVAQELLGMMNDARAQQGLQPLANVGALNGIASGWSEQMASSGAASHNPSFIQQTTASGSTGMAENIAYDVQSRDSARATAQYFFDFWMNSPGHASNIMSPEFNGAGFGLATAADGRVFATQNFGTY